MHIVSDWERVTPRPVSSPPFGLWLEVPKRFDCEGCEERCICIMPTEMFYTVSRKIMEDHFRGFWAEQNVQHHGANLNNSFQTIATLNGTPLATKRFDFSVDWGDPPHSIQIQIHRCETHQKLMCYVLPSKSARSNVCPRCLTSGSFGAGSFRVLMNLFELVVLPRAGWHLQSLMHFLVKPNRLRDVVFSNVFHNLFPHCVALVSKLVWTLKPALLTYRMSSKLQIGEFSMSSWRFQFLAEIWTAKGLLFLVTSKRRVSARKAGHFQLHQSWVQEAGDETSTSCMI